MTPRTLLLTTAIAAAACGGAYAQDTTVIVPAQPAVVVPAATPTDVTTTTTVTTTTPEVPLSRAQVQAEGSDWYHGGASPNEALATRYRPHGGPMNADAPYPDQPLANGIRQRSPDYVGG